MDGGIKRTDTHYSGNDPIPRRGFVHIHRDQEVIGRVVRQHTVFTILVVLLGDKPQRAVALAEHLQVSFGAISRYRPWRVERHY